MITRMLVLVAGGMSIIASASLHVDAAGAQQQPSSVSSTSVSPQRALLDRYCVTCHNQKLQIPAGHPLTLETLNVANVAEHPDIWETVVRKLRAGMMPPAGRPRPDGATYDGFTTWLETELDRAAAARPDPGRTEIFHRLNRAEYQNAIRDLLALEIDIADFLPADDASYGFDNMAGVLRISQSLMERYLTAARTISRLAVGSPPPGVGSETYRIAPDLQQHERIDELPFGTRGGTLVRHLFAQDGEYDIRVEVAGARGLSEAHQLEVTVDGDQVKLFTIAPRQPGMQYEVESKFDVRVPVDAGPREVGVAFYKKPLTLVEQVREPFQNPRISGNDGGPGGALPSITSVTIVGPHNAAGAGDTPSRRRLFVCRPSDGADEAGCARTMLSTLARRAYRGLVTDEDVQVLLDFFDAGRAEGGSFDAGIELALRRLLVSPEFLFRIEADPASTATSALNVALQQTSPERRSSFDRPVLSEWVLRQAQDERSRSDQDDRSRRAQGDAEPRRSVASNTANRGTTAAPNVYRISDLELASRLSFFLWSSIPDDELLDAAEQGRLRDPVELDRQVRRMLADSRSEALTKNFAGQWLQLRNLASSVRPGDPYSLTFDESLRQGLQRETELFFDSVMREDRSVVELLTANYTFLNDRVAQHYGIPNVQGSHFRRVTLPGDSPRRGILGHGSILTLTSHAIRTSPVLRGKWILNNILGTPPPDPPPNVPALVDRKTQAKVQTIRERMSQHRANPVCASCHAMIDPAGFALENFDAIGRWRVVDGSFNPIDTSGVLPDGTKFNGVAELRAALVRRPERFVTTVTEKLLTYALGRGVEYYDMPAVRKIVKESARNDYAFQSIILGVVNSFPFQMRRIDLSARVETAAARP